MKKIKKCERAVSRVLFTTKWRCAVIPLGPMLPWGSNDLPGPIPASGSGVGTPSSLFGLSPGGVYPARDVTAPAVSSYLTISPLPASKDTGGIFSVALSLGLLPVGVTHHPALWSSDFPRLENGFEARPLHSLTKSMVPNRGDYWKASERPWITPPRRMINPVR